MDSKIPLQPQYQPMGVELKPHPDADANPVSCITELAYICHMPYDLWRHQHAALRLSEPILFIEDLGLFLFVCLFVCLFCFCFALFVLLLLCFVFVFVLFS